MTYEDLKDLTKLDHVIRETLRLHAPIHSIMRKVGSPSSYSFFASNHLLQVISDIPVPNSLSSPKDSSEDASYVIPKGHFVLASPGVAQIDRKSVV